MIQRYYNFSIFKADTKGNEKLPTHAISMKVGDKYQNIGGCWTKDGQNGKFLSGQIAKSWKGDGKSREGFVIVPENDLDRLEAKIQELMGTEKILDPEDGRDLTPSAEDIPF
jgi:hypothetical protein